MCLTICATVIISRAAEACSASSAPKSTGTGVTVSSAALIAPSSTRRRDGSSGGSARPRRWRTTLWICDAFSRTCVCASAQPVRAQPRPRHRQRHARVLGRRGDRLAEQRIERCRRGQRRLPPLDQRVREGGGRVGFGVGGRGGDLRLDRCQRRRDALRDGRAGGDRCDLRVQPRQLQPLHFQPQAQRVPPADIGAPVGVVADPTGQDHRRRHDLGPAVRPGGAGGGQDRGGQRIQRVAAVRDRGGGLRELLRQRHPRRAVRGEAHVRRPPARGFRQRLADLGRQREGRMGGEHGGEARRAPPARGRSPAAPGCRRDRGAPAAPPAPPWRAASPWGRCRRHSRPAAPPGRRRRHRAGGGPAPRSPPASSRRCRSAAIPPARWSAPGCRTGRRRGSRACERSARAGRGPGRARWRAPDAASANCARASVGLATAAVGCLGVSRLIAYYRSEVAADAPIPGRRCA